MKKATIPINLEYFKRSFIPDKSISFQQPKLTFLTDTLQEECNSNDWNVRYQAYLNIHSILINETQSKNLNKEFSNLADLLLNLIENEQQFQNLVILLQTLKGTLKQINSNENNYIEKVMIKLISNLSTPKMKIRQLFTKFLIDLIELYGMEHVLEHCLNNINNTNARLRSELVNIINHILLVHPNQHDEQISKIIDCLVVGLNDETARVKFFAVEGFAILNTFKANLISDLFHSNRISDGLKILLKCRFRDPKVPLINSEGLIEYDIFTKPSLSNQSSESDISTIVIPTPQLSHSDSSKALLNTSDLSEEICKKFNCFEDPSKDHFVLDGTMNFYSKLLEQNEDSPIIEVKKVTKFEFLRKNKKKDTVKKSLGSAIDTIASALISDLDASKTLQNASDLSQSENLNCFEEVSLNNQIVSDRQNDEDHPRMDSNRPAKFEFLRKNKKKDIISTTKDSELQDLSSLTVTDNLPMTVNDIDKKSKPKITIKRKIKKSSSVKELDTKTLQIDEFQFNQQVKLPKLKDTIKILKSTDDWNEIVVQLAHLSDIIVKQSPTTSEQVHEINLTVCDQLLNLRTSVSKVAVKCLDNLFIHTSKLMEPGLDLAVTSLLKKIGEGNKFIVEEIETCLTTMCQHMNPLKSMNSLLLNSVRKNHLIRQRVIEFIYTLIQQHMSETQLLRQLENDKLSLMLVTYLNQGSLKIRDCTKKCILALSTLPGFMEAEKRFLTPSQLQDVETILRKQR
ncbi:armadillo-type protein [Globomyces pollinis-pini]|nr:armadillo-type protein [Globomyces pollinis-pini]